MTTDGPRPEDYDPMKEPAWSLAMAAAWVATRNVENVRWQLPKWRAANALPRKVSIALASNALVSDDDDDSQHPMFFHTTEGVSGLRNACIEGRIMARGIASGATRNAMTAMTVEDWIFGELTFGSQFFEEVWSTPDGVHFRDITFLRDEVLSVWPPPTGALLTAPSQNAGNGAVVSTLEDSGVGNGTIRRRGAYRTEARRIIYEYLQARYDGKFPQHRSDAVLVHDIREWGEKRTSGIDKRAARSVNEGHVKTYRKNFG